MINKTGYGFYQPINTEIDVEEMEDEEKPLTTEQKAEIKRKISEGMLSPSVAKNAAEQILEGLMQAKKGHCSLDGKVHSGVVCYEHDLHASDIVSPDEIYERSEKKIIDYSARLQAEVLDRAADPNSPGLKAAREAVGQARFVYDDKFDMAVGKARIATEKKIPISIPLEDRTKTSEKTTQKDESLVLRLFEEINISSLISERENVYKETDVSYEVPKGQLQGIPRPAKLAIVYRDQRAKLDVEKSLELNGRRASQIRLKLEEFVKPENREGQFELQQLINSQILPKFKTN